MVSLPSAWFSKHREPMKAGWLKIEKMVAVVVVQYVLAVDVEQAEVVVWPRDPHDL
jgi:hypothetical protein